MQWDRLFDRDLVVVSGKGGAGKSTVAAVLAAAAAARGRSALLVEVEGRHEVVGTVGMEDPGYAEAPTPLGFRAISITPHEAAEEYFRLFVGFDRATRLFLRAKLIEQVIEAAPGFRDLLTCGKLYEIVGLRTIDPRLRARRRYDLVVVDGPPTGQIVSFLSAPAAFAELVRVGRVRRQAAGIERLFRSRAQVILVSLAEEMSVAETLEAVPAIEATGVPVAGVVANQLVPQIFPSGTRRAAARLTAEDVARSSGRAGLQLDDEDAAALLAGSLVRARRHRQQAKQVARLRRAGPVFEMEVVPGAEGRALVRTLVASIEPSFASDPARSSSACARPSSRPIAVARSLGGHLGDARILVVAGAGGVGKTTTSAAIAVHLAGGGRRVVLLTVDPARRLATALHLPMIPGERTLVRLGRGRRLEAMQLDTKRTFDELVRRHAAPQRRDRILANPFYQRIADTLAGTHEYMAMEKLFELAVEEDHDLIVIDTPPTRSALSFLEAPKRLTEFLGGRFLRWFLWPTARAGRLTLGLARFGAEAFRRTIGRVVGAETLADVAEFLGAFEGMYGGFSERATSVLNLLRSPRCAFVVVTAPAGPSADEAAFFVSRLWEEGMHPAALVVNRWHPEAADLPPGSARAADRLKGGPPADRAVGAILEDRMRREPQRAAEASAIARFAGRHRGIPIVAVPELADDVHDLRGLRRMAAGLFGDEAPNGSASGSATAPTRGPIGPVS